MRDLAATDRRTVNQLVGGIFGVVYLAVGLIGFAVTSGIEFAGTEGDHLLGIFELNPLHNIVHLAVGLAGLAMSRRTDTARTYGWILVVAYGAVFLYGLFAAGQPDINFLALNAADNVLHILTVGLGLAMALVPVRRTARA